MLKRLWIIIVKFRGYGIKIIGKNYYIKKRNDQQYFINCYLYWLYSNLEIEILIY